MFNRAQPRSTKSRKTRAGNSRATDRRHRWVARIHVALRGSVRALLPMIIGLLTAAVPRDVDVLHCRSLDTQADEFRTITFAARPPLARWHDAYATRRRILTCSCRAWWSELANIAAVCSNC